MSTVRISVEMRPREGRDTILPQELGGLLFRLTRVGEKIDEGLEFQVHIGDAFPDASVKVATVSFHLPVEKAMPAALVLDQLNIHFVPNLTGKSREESEALLDHDLVYRVQESK